ncbi:MAG: hypothetical protein ACKVQS_04660 [Fimbriimonadaceae bacterium]
MKILTTIITALAIALLAISGATVARQHHGQHTMGHQHPGNSITISAKELGLTPDQSDKIKKIQEVATTKAHQVGNNTSLSPQEKSTALEQIHKDAMTEVKKVLTPEQFGELMIMKHSAQMHEHLKLMAGSLNLTETQQTAIKAIVEESIATYRQLAKNKNLTDAERDEQASDLHKATLEKIHAVLTPAQIEAIKKLHGDRIPA